MGGKNASRAYFAKTGSKNVTYLSPKLGKKVKTAVVPSALKIGKKTYKVTAVSPYAFTGCDGLKAVRIGKNVKRIGDHAFFGCDKLRTLYIASTKLTKKGVKGCLKGGKIRRVVVMKRAESRYRSYKKLFTGMDKSLSVVKER